MGTLEQDLLSRGMELRETHISKVFLAQDVVYKLKKPVKLGFLDFSTLPERKRYCEAELELNRRLAERVYRKVEPVMRDANGTHRIGGQGEVVDYVVVMQRLADADAASERLAAGRLTLDDVERLALRVAEFHAATRCDHETAQYGEREVIEGNVVENFEQTRQSAGEFLSKAELVALEHWQREFLQQQAARFEARSRAGRIRDGHGDLRLEHCYLGDDGSIQIIDCIEFNERFRYGDVCADVAFLAMDLTWHERPDLSEALLAAYARAADDFDLYGVVDFYQSYRAYVRGKVSSILAEDESAPSAAREQARGTSRKYYVLAAACTREPLEKPTLYVTCGLIASGKSFVASELGRMLHAPVTDADHVRKHSAKVELHAQWHDDAFAGRYAPEQTDKVYEELIRRAEVVLRSGRSVILDASFRGRVQRTAARELAERVGCECLFVEASAAPEVCRSRLRERARSPSVSDGRIDIFDAFMKQFEVIDELPAGQHSRIDTGGSQDQTRAQIARLLRG